MVEKITEITPAQQARFPEWVDKWTAVGTSTERADFKTAEEVIKKIYKSFGEPEPVIIHAASPKAGILEALKHELGDRTPTKQELSWSITNTYGGAMIASWVSYVTFFRDVMDWENETLEAFALYETLTLTCGWVFWGNKSCAIIDRPEVIKFDDEKNLHCEDGPAIKYTDGWSVYSWHGTRIPGKWIEDRENLDPMTALTWENVEQRRCAAEIIGWHNVLDKLKVKVIDDDGDPEIGTLVEVNIPDIGKERFLKVQCGTGRTFALPVPPEMQTAIQAQAWTFNLDLEEFTKPEVRT